MQVTSATVLVNTSRITIQNNPCSHFSYIKLHIYLDMSCYIQYNINTQCIMSWRKIILSYVKILKDLFDIYVYEMKDLFSFTFNFQVHPNTTQTNK